MKEWSNTTSSKNDIDTHNIFDEFSVSDTVAAEVKDVEEKRHKDLYYYLEKISKVSFVCNILFFLFIMVSYTYIYLQNSPTKKEYSFLTPICNIFLWKAEIWWGSCFGVTALEKEYRDKLDTEREIQIGKILPLLWETYSMENFAFSQRVSFLLEKSESRLRPLEILSEFDEIKNKFAPTDKWEISCYDITISWKSLIQLNCDAFSADWDKSIVDLQNGSIWSVSGGGTSISRASSFINFLEKYPNSPFQILNKPTTFNSVNVQSWPYTNKTTIQLQMQYTGANNLSF